VGHDLGLLRRPGAHGRAHRTLALNKWTYQLLGHDLTNRKACHQLVEERGFDRALCGYRSREHSAGLRMTFVEQVHDVASSEIWSFDATIPVLLVVDPYAPTQ
jgi:hypothetical protein